jgi:protease-4
MDTPSYGAAGSAGEPGRGQAPAPTNIIVQQPRGFFARFGKLIFAALVVSVMINFSQRAAYEAYFSSDGRVDEKYYSGDRTGSDKIALIRVEGAILQTEGYIKRQIDAVRDDDSVKAVVLRIDSPGGTVTASDYLYHHLREMTDERQIPLVVSMGGLCASGGYYLAMAVGDTKDAIFAEPTTWTGSIGVVIPHYDVSGLLASVNVEEDGIVSGPFKQMGHPARPMTDEEREILQSLVDDSFTGFKEVVQAGRPKFRDDPAALDGVADGRIFTAKQAESLGLVDQIGFVEAAIERAAELANLDPENTRVVEYDRVFTSLEELFLGVQSTAKPSIDLSGLAELATPRAYYLWSWLPAAFVNRGA